MLPDWDMLLLIKEKPMGKADWIAQVAAESKIKEMDAVTWCDKAFPITAL